MNPNIDNMANPDKTFVDINIDQSVPYLNLPKFERGMGKKRNEKQTRIPKRQTDITDPMLNLLLPQNLFTRQLPTGDTLEDEDSLAIYRQPNNEEETTPKIPQINLDVPRFERKKSTFRPNPMDSELGASQVGKRWYWNLENSFMMPGSTFSKQVMEGVGRERPFETIINGKATSSANLTPAQARERQQDINNWNKFIEGIKQGHHSSQGRLNPNAEQWANSYQETFAKKWGKESLPLLTPIPDQFGKRGDLARKSLQDIQNDLNYTENILDNIEDWAADGSLEDPIKASMIKNYMDKVSQALSAMLGGDSKSMADAEKVRIQILYLPEESMELVKRECANYAEFLESIMEYGAQNGWSGDIIGKINAVKDAYSMASMANGKGNISTLVFEAAGLGSNLIPFVSQHQDEFAINLPEILEAGKEAHENYMRQMVLAADVDPSLVYQFAEILHQNLARNYNRRAKDFERSERNEPRDNTRRPDLKALSKKVRPSPFLKPVDYKKLKIHKPRQESFRQNPQDIISKSGASKYINLNELLGIQKNIAPDTTDVNMYEIELQ